MGMHDIKYCRTSMVQWDPLLLPLELVMLQPAMASKTTSWRDLRYFTGEAGQYQPLLPAPYDPATGTCLNQQANLTSGSFRAPESPSLGLMDLLRFTMAGFVQTQEAADTCASAAEPAVPETRQAGDYDVTAPPDQAGQWQLIRNSEGRASTGVVAIHAALLPNSSQVLLWARVHMDYSRDNYEPGVVATDGAPEVSAVFDPTNGEYSVKRMRLTPFCTGNSHLADGRVLAAGGDDFAGDRLSPGYTNGLRGLRLYQKPTPGTWRDGGWKTLNNQLGEPRWYPTQALMPDGVRTLVVGGTRSQNTSTPVPSAEIYSSATLGIVSLATLGVLERFIGFTLYPLVYSLPYLSLGSSGTTQVFMFNCDRGAVLNLAPNNTWSEYRDIPSALWPTPGFCGAMSMAGTATMLMLEPEAGYAAEVVMFGGFQRGRRSRFTTLAATNIDRYYHSTALLLPDASILVMGSEYGTCSRSCADRTPWEFQHRAERFLPPYFFGTSRPDIELMSATELRYGATLDVMYTGNVTGAVLMTPAAVTHQRWATTLTADTPAASAASMHAGSVVGTCASCQAAVAALLPQRVKFDDAASFAVLTGSDLPNKGGEVAVVAPNSFHHFIGEGLLRFQVQDVTDSTSYYICCGGDTPVVRKTCRYFTGETGQYQPLLPAPYDPATGACLNRQVNATAGSFAARQSSSLGMVERVRFAMARSASTDEARETCGAAAAPAAPEARPAGNFSIANAVGGEWRLIRDRAGRSSTGVVAINAVLLPNSSQVLFWSRVHMDLSRDNYEPGVVSSDGVPEVSVVYDPTNGEYSVKRMRLTPFCTGNSHLADGRVLAAGGDDFAGDRFSPGYTNGLRGLRLYQKPTPGTWRDGGWKTSGNQLRAPRWYPTQTLLPDGVRTVITGGTVSQNTSTPVPSAEIYSQAAFGSVKIDTLPLLERFRGFILYPLVYVLPFTSSVSPGTTHLFMFNCNNGGVMRLTPGNTWSQYRDIPSALWPTPGFCGAMSMAGTATMLMLEPEAGYAAEVVMFGGFQRGTRQCDCDTATNRYAHRLRLDKRSVDDNRFAW
ncbi:hypothetical protein COO60DRAFT_1655315 [Scenedesmus sp. NREL 46B-D3]|nr:hypothetical protein COO60DRAFT_1655315 [Scenedesmus sp. NREL 46B-D3]